MARLREWGAHCRRGHDHFASKAAELDADLLALKREVEGLLVQVGQGQACVHAPGFYTH